MIHNSNPNKKQINKLKKSQKKNIKLNNFNQMMMK